MKKKTVESKANVLHETHGRVQIFLEKIEATNLWKPSWKNIDGLIHLKVTVLMADLYNFLLPYLVQTPAAALQLLVTKLRPLKQSHQ